MPASRCAPSRRCGRRWSRFTWSSSGRPARQSRNESLTQPDVPLFLTQLRFELLKMFARKRTYIGFGAFLLMECIILMICNLRGPQMALRRMIEQNGYGADEYFSGYTVALMIVHWTSTLLGSLYLALIAGDLMAKEVEEGTMRMLLCRPISRLRVTLLKYLSAIIYTFVLIAFIG